MKRFFYSAVQKGKECEGIVRADTIDSARRKLQQEGYEEITLSILSSIPLDVDQEDQSEDGDVP